jgi:hypothetical protein
VTWVLRFVVPLLLPAAVYWWTLDLWFRADDFAWLSQGLTVQTPAEWGAALFTPRAQGTVRFLSERLFFLSFWKGFGFNAVPYRLAILLLLSGSCLFLSELARQIRASWWVPGLVTVFWVSQTGVAAAMGWLSAANQIWCAFFLLGALLAFTRGRYGLCWAIFLAGLGTLETIVVLPVLAMLWAFLAAVREDPAVAASRRRAAFWLLVPAAVYAAAHWLLIPKTVTDPAYRVSVDAGAIAQNALRYIRPLSVAAGLVLPLAWAMWRRGWGALLGPVAFLILLAPVLPLTQKFEGYYLALPTAGLALGLAAAEWPVSVLAVAAALIQAPSGFQERERSEQARVLVRGVLEARRLHPDSAILLTGISNQLFWDAVFDDPFRLAGTDRVYLAPGAEQGIAPHPEWGGIGRWLVPPVTASDWMDRGAAEVYQPAGAALANVTARFSRGFGRELAAEVDVGDPAFAAQIGDGWHEAENRARWMARRGSVRLNAARGTRLELAAYCPASSPDLWLAVTADGAPAGRLPVCRQPGPSVVETSIPPAVRGRPELTILLEASSLVSSPGDPRELSLVFGRVAVRE